MYYIRFLDGAKRWKILGKDNKSCRRRKKAKLFDTLEKTVQRAQKLISLGSKARISGPIDPVTFKTLPKKKAKSAAK